MNEQTIYHHGIKGQKWGVRRYQNKDGSLTPSGKRRYNSVEKSSYSDQISKAKAAYKANKKRADSDYSKAGEEYDKLTKGGRVQNKKADDAFNAAADKWMSDRKAAKNAYNQAKTEIKKRAVSDYSKKLDEADRAYILADKKWNEVSEQYKSLGKTAIARMINAARNETDAAKKYNRDYSTALSMLDRANEKWAEAMAAYRETGRNVVDRILNNVKYDTNR